MDVALRQVLLDCPEMDDSQIAAGEEGCILNFLESCTPEGYIPIFIHTFEDADMTGGLDTNMHKPNLAQHAAFVTRCTGQRRVHPAAYGNDCAVWWSGISASSAMPAGCFSGRTILPSVWTTTRPPFTARRTAAVPSISTR